MNVPADDVSGEPSAKKAKLTEDECSAESEKEISTEQLKPLSEIDVGITEYLSSHDGFTGILKQRYSDFLVNEIDVSGKRVILTDAGEPACDNQSEEKEQEFDLTDLFSSHKLEEIKQADSERKGEVWIPAGEDKAKRSFIHQAVRKHFTNLASQTEDKDGAKFIKIFPTKSKYSKQKRGWPKGQEYCKFILYKQNVDTQEAINILAKYMKINAGAFTYAGTKDKRAKTCQYLTCHRVEATRLHKLNRVLRGMTLGNFSYCHAALKLGDLQGNHFTTVLRNVTGTDEQIHAGMEVLSRLGFINYFGMQRFGTTCVPTHHVGRAILHSKWEEAVDLILKPRGGDSEELAKTRAVWQKTRDADAALTELGKRTGIERHLLKGLSKCGTDLVAAINHIPKNTRLMYVHSYQAFIWNRMVSERLKLAGTKLVPGDLVIASSQEKKSTPVVITNDNIDKFTIQDLVLPAPGYDVIYPEGEMMEKYKHLLAEDGFGLDSFRHKIKDYSLSGMYRSVLHKPTELKYEIIKYSDYSKALILSDLEKLKGETLPEDNGDAMKALKLEFSLLSSTYATMLVREVLKCDTSAAFQTTLNVK